MSNLTSDHEVEVAVYSQAKREARHYGIDSPSDCERLAEAIRYRHFRRAIEPYERMRNKPVLDYLSLQTRPGMTDPATYPAWLKEHIALFDELIASEARKYGYIPHSAEGSPK